MIRRDSVRTVSSYHAKDRPTEMFDSTHFPRTVGGFLCTIMYALVYSMAHSNIDLLAHNRTDFFCFLMVRYSNSGAEKLSSTMPRVYNKERGRVSYFVCHGANVLRIINFHTHLTYTPRNKVQNHTALSAAHMQPCLAVYSESTAQY